MRVKSTHDMKEKMLYLWFLSIYIEGVVVSSSSVETEAKGILYQ